MKFSVTILGSGAASPTLKRANTAQLININEHLSLVDCGEGTQLRLRKFEVKFQRISSIYISHLHGDHYLGLPGLMSSMHLLGRIKPLKIFGPENLKELITLNMKYSETFLGYHWEFFPLTSGDEELINDEHDFLVYSIPLRHRIDCHGFKFVEKPRARKIIKTAIEEFGLSLEQVVAIKNGYQIVNENGNIIGPDDVSVLPPVPRTYVYCSDTAYSSKTSEYAKNADLLYHEATFMADMADRASATYHSTSAEAARVASDACVKRLVIGHFSTRYRDIGPLLDEATAVFPETIAAFDGLVVDV